MLHLFQAVAATDGLTVDSVWLVTRAAQPIDDRADPIEVMQSPLWGLGRVASNEYQNMHCRLVDLATCSSEEIAALADELSAPDEAEDEIALHGELRYVHRLLPVSPATMHGLGRRAEAASQPFRIELQRPGILDSLSARPLARTPPSPNEIEIEVVATGLNFKDLMMGMGMLPKEAMAEQSEGGKLLGLECAGRVVAVGDAGLGIFRRRRSPGRRRARLGNSRHDRRSASRHASRATSASSRLRQFRSPILRRSIRCTRSARCGGENGC